MRGGWGAIYGETKIFHNKRKSQRKKFTRQDHTIAPSNVYELKHKRPDGSNRNNFRQTRK